MIQKPTRAAATKNSIKVTTTSRNGVQNLVDFAKTLLYVDKLPLIYLEGYGFAIESVLTIVTRLMEDDPTLHIVTDLGTYKRDRSHSFPQIFICVSKRVF